MCIIPIYTHTYIYLKSIVHIRLCSTSIGCGYVLLTTVLKQGEQFITVAEQINNLLMSGFCPPAYPKLFILSFLCTLHLFLLVAASSSLFCTTYVVYPNANKNISAMVCIL